MVSLLRGASPSDISRGEARMGARARDLVARQRLAYICILGRKNPHSSLRAA
ncbi:MAG: hypothetical protein H7841_06605 [Magnetospirillum sp. WYHS-4]